MRVVDWLADTPAVRVVQLPRPTTAQQVSDPGFDDRRTAPVAAYHAASATRTPLLFGWQRIAAGGPVGLLVAGAASGLAPAADGLRIVALPPGGQGVSWPPESCPGRWPPCRTGLRSRRSTTY